MRCCSARREDDAVLANKMNNNEGAVAMSGLVQVPVVVGQSSEVEGPLELLSGHAVQRFGRIAHCIGSQGAQAQALCGYPIS